MALPVPRASDADRRWSATPVSSVVVDLHGQRALDDLRPGGVVRLIIAGPGSGSAELWLSGAGARSFRALRSARRDEVVVTAAAPGLARLTVVLAGRCLLDARLVCRSPDDDVEERCRRALIVHQDRLRQIDGFAITLAGVVSQVRSAAATRLRAHSPQLAMLSSDREAHLVLSERSHTADRDARIFLQELWARVVRHGVATRAVVVLAPHDPSLSREAPRFAITSVEDVRDRILAATQHEARLVSELLAAWPRSPVARTTRAPDLELAAALGSAVPAPPDVATVARVYWRAWLLEHALEIVTTSLGPLARWTIGHPLLIELARELSPGWLAAVRGEAIARQRSAGERSP
jgi:hypothetical protein